MEWSKLKNIVILILLLLNIFLLFLAGGREEQRKSIALTLQENTVSVLNQAGLNLKRELVPWGGSCQAMITERDETEEARLARTILGEVQGSAVGIATEYRGERGSMRFYPDGRFSLSFTQQQGESTLNPERHATKLLKKMGVEVLVTKQETQEKKSTLRFVQMCEKLPVFSCEIEARYEDSRLVSLQGKRLLGNVKPDTTQMEVLTAPDMLLHFLEIVQTEGLSCQEIRAITWGYVYATGSLSTQASLIPVWLIETDAGSYLLNALTGKRETPSRWLYSFAENK